MNREVSKCCNAPVGERGESQLSYDLYCTKCGSSLGSKDIMLSHAHCWTSENPPCGKKAHARCCLCEEPAPKKCEHGNEKGCLACYKPTPPTNDWEKKLEDELERVYFGELHSVLGFTKRITSIFRTLLKSKAVEIEEEMKMTRLCLSPEAEKVMDIAEQIIKSKLL